MRWLASARCTRWACRWPPARWSAWSKSRFRCRTSRRSSPGRRAGCEGWTMSAVYQPPAFGSQLRRWRGQRGLSQLALALQADVSARHLSWLETGKAEPSRAMVLRLAEQLDLPLRERNALLVAAGYAPLYRESPLDDAALAPARGALQRLLDAQEPA